MFSFSINFFFFSAVNLISMFAVELKMQNAAIWDSISPYRIGTDETYCRCFHIKFKFQTFFSAFSAFLLL